MSFLGYFAYLKYIPTKHIKRISDPDYIDAYPLYIRRFVNEFRAQQAHKQSDVSASPKNTEAENGVQTEDNAKTEDNAQAEIDHNDGNKSPKADASSPQPISFWSSRIRHSLSTLHNPIITNRPIRGDWLTAHRNDA